MLPNITASSKNETRTTVLLCEDLADLGAGLNLGELQSSLEASFPGIAVELVPDLCSHPTRLSLVSASQDDSRAVLGLCSKEYSQVELQTRARKIGLDPFGLEVVPLGTLCARVHPKSQATEKAKMLLGAAVARAHAFAGSRPDHAKLFFLPLEQKVTRRSLFTVPPVGYCPVPSIRNERCAADSGCQLCTGVCPQDAMQKTGGRLFLDKTKCEGCGVCLAVCPREAIDFPSWSLSQFESQLATLLDSTRLGSESFGLLFTCQRSFGKLEELARRGVSYSHQWLPVAMPCLGMITPTWLLQVLAHGAAAVTLFSCDAKCTFGQEQVIGGRVNFCRRLLRLLGQAPERVQVLSTSHPERLLRVLQEPPLWREGDHHGRPVDRLCLANTEGAFQAIRYLNGAGHSLSGVALEHPHSPFGVLELRAEACTGCLACVETCPTGALSSERDGDEVVLTYIASRCTGCAMCVDICPETTSDALRVRKMTDLDTLSRGKIVLHKNKLLTCESCGASIASQALLRRIEVSLEADNEALRTILSRYCPSCRLSLALSARPY